MHRILGRLQAKWADDEEGSGLLLGVDVAAREIRVVRLELASRPRSEPCGRGTGLGDDGHKDYRLCGYGIAGFERGDEQSCLGGLLARLGVRRPRAALAVSAAESASLRVGLRDGLARSDVEASVLRAVEDSRSLPLEGMYFDYCLVAEPEGEHAVRSRREARVFAAEQSVVDARVSWARRAGVCVPVVDMEALAIQRCLSLQSASRPQSRPETTAVIALEEERGCVHLFAAGHYALSEEWRTPSEGSAPSTLCERVEEAVAKLLSQQQLGRVDQAFLCGGAPQLGALRPRLSAVLECVVEEGGFIREVARAPGVDRLALARDSQSLWVAFGLAMRRGDDRC